MFASSTLKNTRAPAPQVYAKDDSTALLRPTFEEFIKITGIDLGELLASQGPPREPQEPPRNAPGDPQRDQTINLIGQRFEVLMKK